MVQTDAQSVQLHRNIFPNIKKVESFVALDFSILYTISCYVLVFSLFARNRQQRHVDFRHQHGAIRGYEVGATDFIVKPVHYYDFRLKLERAVSHIDMQTQQKISIKIDDSIKCVRAGDIMYVEGIKHKLVSHTVNETLETYGTLKQVEAVLSGANFVRCNQCYLVNLSRGGWCCSDLST